MVISVTRVSSFDKILFKICERQFVALIVIMACAEVVCGLTS